VREIERLLAPGGCVVATAPNGEELVLERVRCPDCGATFHRWQHQRALTPESLAALFGRFEVVCSEGLHWKAGGLRSRAARLLGRVGPAPHLLYVGRRPVTSMPLPP
jgi:hypothetical protein